MSTFRFLDRLAKTQLNVSELSWRLFVVPLTIVVLCISGYAEWTSLLGTPFTSEQFSEVVTSKDLEMPDRASVVQLNTQHYARRIRIQRIEPSPWLLDYYTVHAEKGTCFVFDSSRYPGLKRALQDSLYTERKVGVLITGRGYIEGVVENLPAEKPE